MDKIGPRAASLPNEYSPRREPPPGVARRNLLKVLSAAANSAAVIICACVGRGCVLQLYFFCRSVGGVLVPTLFDV
eukprot:scaffold215316_cov42-Prasinocladus_malaysianus.AAC.1